MLPVIMLIFLLFLFFPSCLSIDIIAMNESITESNILLSRNEIFALGFFSPGNSKYRYLGIWYHNLPVKTVVWVANRNTPINGSSGILSISSVGNLAVYADQNREFPLWSTNVSFRGGGGGAGGSLAQILDSGNFVLMKNEETVWQSFDYPTDTMLPGLKLGLDRKLGLNRVLTSWKSSDDPRTGDWLYKLDPSGSPQYVLYNGSIRYWRTDPWPWDVERTPGYTAITANNQDEIYYSFIIDDESVLTRVVVTVAGFMQRLTWDNSSLQWRESRSEPKYVYGHCGAYSILNANNFDGLECSCLPGYEPKSLQNWNLRDGSAGCVQKRNETKALPCSNGEGFVKVEHVKLPDTSISALLSRNLSSKECEKLCLRNCTCKAFSRLDIERKGIGCLTWYGELFDTVKNTEGNDVYIRVDAEELAEYATKRNGFLRKKGMLAILVVSAVLAMFFIVLFGYVLTRKKRKTKENRQSPDLLVFTLRAISIATNNFDAASKLGQGGFGSVYKGQLDDGQEIAVKRLSRDSGQGAAEFENEVMLIAKLQHRNLVKLLGCCIQNEEQMLIYEYLPNKSLDHFIFETKIGLGLAKTI
ncbi:G-type lectin S-receptor-like serine/threonine-protein kinase RKS1 isoform X2 [Euphorbia lathyris]|uniref:G-type lectin S-receptor-like serine/threonine-protein kinase RKS1 isoform X2 n=1 Tax=Euphorbia lathyris TaxID=212925 RepID=UPI003313A73C